MWKWTWQIRPPQNTGHISSVPWVSLNPRYIPFNPRPTRPVCGVVRDHSLHWESGKASNWIVLLAVCQQMRGTRKRDLTNCSTLRGRTEGKFGGSLHENLVIPQSFHTSWRSYILKFEVCHCEKFVWRRTETNFRMLYGDFTNQCRILREYVTLVSKWHNN